MAKRVYTETVKKWLIGSGITVGTLIGGIFFYLFAIGAISNVSYSGDSICAGTELDPCYAYINFTANEDIFIYPTNYDPWGRDTLFDFDPAVKSWKLQRSWGKGWRNIPLDRSCTGTWCGLSSSKDTRKFSVAFREGRDYQIRIVAYKNSLYDRIKWGAFSGVDEIDPVWASKHDFEEEKGIYLNELNGLKTEIDSSGNVELSKWDGEVYMIIEKPDVYPILSLTSSDTSDNKLITKTSNDVDLEWYFKEIDGLSRLEYDVILKSKPSTNIFSFPIESENLNFYYQSALNIEMNNISCNATDCQGSHRPVDVVGSYAVYHSFERDNKYTTGKVFHIYRPLIVDANNNSIWAELNIENGLMTITISQDFLDKAVYPVVIDPSFGISSQGDTGQAIAGGEIFALLSNAPGNGDIDNISAYIYGGPGNANFKGVMTLNSTLGILTDGVGSAIPCGSSGAAWLVSIYSSKPSITSGTNYLIGVIADGFGVCGLMYDTGTSNVSAKDSTNNYGTPVDWGTATFANDAYSVYASYTEGEPEDTCTYSSGNWNVDCSDDCSITSNVNLGGNNISLKGSGAFSIRANITNFNKIFLWDTCDIKLYPGGQFK